MIFPTMRVAAFAVALAGIAPAFKASAHVTLETRQAPVDSRYKAVLRVPHGCHGSATTELKVRIPDGVLGVKPQPKPGWKLGIVKADYDHPYKLYGATVTSGVRELSWTGRLPDDEYDEFVFVGYLSDSLKPGSTLYFPVVQKCEKGVSRWIDRPAEGAGHGDESGHPAPSLKVLPKR